MNGKPPSVAEVKAHVERLARESNSDPVAVAIAGAREALARSPAPQTVRAIVTSRLLAPDVKRAIIGPPFTDPRFRRYDLQELANRVADRLWAKELMRRFYEGTKR